ncbi:MAG: hypothetical protein ABIJ00_00745 [Candidatus Eisenbacteria bacterium]
MRVIRLILWPVLVFLIAGMATAYVFDSVDVSSKARGMAGAWIASADDATAIFYNPACLVGVSGRSVCASYLKPNSQSFESLTFLAASMPVRPSHGVAVSYRSFGVEFGGQDLMGESTFSVAHGMVLMKDIHSSLHVGYGLNIYSLDFGSTGTMDLGSQTTFGIDIGMLAILRDRTMLGFFLKNVNEPSLGKVDREPLPQWLTAGIAYKPYYGVITELDIRSVRGEDVEIHMGMQFNVTEFLDMRFGFQTEPNSLTGGFTVGVEPLAVDYSYSSHTVLPGTHHMSLRAVF